MKLKEFTVREFRSIWDSSPIEIEDDITCLVGKNESGKTALLQALYKTNPIIDKHAKFELLYDYPKREVEDYQFALVNQTRDEVVVVKCVYELEDKEKKIINGLFGPNALKADYLVQNAYYGESNYERSIDVDNQAAINYLASKFENYGKLMETLDSVDDWNSFHKVVEEIEDTEANSEIKKLVSSVIDSDGLENYISNNIILPEMPKFLYFDEYYQMTGHTNLNNLIERKKNSQLLESDRPLLGLIKLARLNPEILLNTQKTIELKNRLEGAGNYVTRKIINYWSQNKHIQMKFDVRDAKPSDPIDMRDGVNIWGEVYDSVHWATTPLGSRSRGFIWFFSFLAWYESIKNQNIILLLDEPGLSLHGRAQGDLLCYFKEQLSRHQLIYSTHSPFMIDPRNFLRNRIVQDLGLDSDNELPKDQDGTKVTTNVLEATDDSLFPLQGALGYDIHQTLFVGPEVLVVEGASDMLYLQAISSQLERESRTSLSNTWTLTPVGGSGKVPTFVALLTPQRGLNVVTLLDFQTKDRQMIQNLYKKKLLAKKKVLTYADILEQNEADIEDLFDKNFYVELVNKEFEQQLEKPIDVDNLNSNSPRILKALEEYFVEHPLKYGEFGHYRPARYFFENIAELWLCMSNSEKSKYETLFEKVNSLCNKVN